MRLSGSGEKEYCALIVDDSGDIRDLLAMALEREGIHCDQAGDGVIAENMARARQYDVVITDLKMPRKHGHELIVDLLDGASPPLLIAMTGLIEPRLVADLIMRGVADVAMKPIPYDLFAAKVKALLRRLSEQPRSSGGRKDILLAEKLSGVTAQLKAQLSEATASFQQTIRSLETQTESLEAGLVDSVRVLANVMNQVGQSRGTHAVRVEAMAASIACKMEMSKAELRNVKIAALLHDIGQFGMPDAIRMRPPWALGEEEREDYVKYPLIGAAILAEIHGADAIVRLIETHAENFDGSGVPLGRRGEDVSLGARIIRIADGCDTFLTYANQESPLEAVREHLNAQRGKAYDPALVSFAFEYLRTSTYTAAGEKTALIDAQNIRPGLILAESLYDSEGHFLAREGLRLTGDVVERLRSLLGHQAVKVVEPA